MLIGNSIYLRLFEPGDFEFTHKWHTDPEIQASLCMPRRFISKEIEKNWALSKASNNNADIYLAICDKATDKMIGWYSMNNIDYRNRKCHCGGVVIGDREFRNGDAYQEAGLLCIDYLFEQMNMHRITGACLESHVMSRATLEARGFVLEGVERDTLFKDGKYHTVYKYSLLENEYRQFKANFQEKEYLKKLVAIAKRIKKELKEKAAV